MGLRKRFERTPHPAELLGDDWRKHGDWEIEADEGVLAVVGKQTTLICGLLEIGGKPGGPADQRLFV